jgi:glyceraldehyde 3-phosphate dehydrogenase
MTMSSRKIRLGLMGLGEIGRQLYHLAARSDDMEVVAISDIGKPEILHYLLGSSTVQSPDVTLQGNYLVNPRFRTRVLSNDLPTESPWDVFDIDLVIDTTGKYHSRQGMQAHISSGAPRALMAGLPEGEVDRLVLWGLNENEASVADQVLSAGSATTTAMALVLKILGDAFPINAATMTSVHAYTSDQPVQDYAGVDFRRSRSAASNIIPNTHDAIPCLEQALPHLAGKLSGHALNVPVHKGSLLDVNLVFADEQVDADAVNSAMRAACAEYPGVIDVVSDPIVSSDVIGNQHSLLFDEKGTLSGGRNMVKVLCWYETLGHACRLLDVARLYAKLDQAGGE